MLIIDTREGKLIELIKNTLSLVLYLFSTPPSELFKLLSHSREQLPKISTRAGKNGKFSGVANDYLFQAIHTQGAHEPHFDEVVNILVNHLQIQDYKIIHLCL